MQVGLIRIFHSKFSTKQDSGCGLHEWLTENRLQLKGSRSSTTGSLKRKLAINYLQNLLQEQAKSDEFFHLQPSIPFSFALFACSVQGWRKFLCSSTDYCFREHAATSSCCPFPLLRAPTLSSYSHVGSS